VDDTEDFCKWCLSEFSYKDEKTPEGFVGETVMMAPAAGFYRNRELGKNQVRMAYVLKKEDLARALTILEKALEAYNGKA
jgi:aspartate aminotransferase